MAVAAKPRRLATVAIALLLAMGGCSTDRAKSNDFAIYKDLMRQVLPGGQKAAAPPKDAGLTREAVEAAGTDLLLVTALNTGVDAAMVVFGQNGGTVTWSSADKRTVSLRDGQIVATRGLSGDLMSAEIPAASTIRAGAGGTARAYYVLDGEDNTQREAFACQLSRDGAETLEIVGRSHATQHVKEVCRSDGRVVTNHYWVESSGFIRQSRQWVSPSVGYLLLRRLNQ
ncbi:MAG: YjbF family lipoprotein [Paracoccaceae bacterium]